MGMTAEAAAWLGRVRHDLVKRLVWPARDRRELGGVPAPGELLPRLTDEDGRPVSARALWAELAAKAPAAAARDGLEAFARAVTRAETAAAAGDLDGVLSLETAFDTLARELERRSQGGS